MREQTKIPPRASRTQDYPVEPEDDDSLYPQRMPTSTRRYVDTRGHQVIQQGNRRIVIHDEPPPKKGRNHSILFIGIGMGGMVALYVCLQMLVGWWSVHQLDSTYGFPRTYQVDEIVGHSDSTDHPTHFTFENLNKHVIIIELPGGDVSHARIYSGPTLLSDGGELIPVTAEFKDVNGDGKIDIILHIQDQRIVYLNDGTQFKPQQ